MKPGEKFSHFKSQIAEKAKQLNMMSNKEVVSEDDKVTVIMQGVRKHHLRTFTTVLDILEQAKAGEELDLETVYKKMLPSARREEEGGSIHERREGALCL
jgi:paraquat-inducible protein B